MVERLFWQLGSSLVAVAVVERFKQESMVWTVRRDKKKCGRCREVTVSGGWTVVCIKAANNSGHMIIQFTST